MWHISLPHPPKKKETNIEKDLEGLRENVGGRNFGQKKDF